MEEYKINEIYKDIEEIVKSNPVVLNWLFKNQNMMMGLGLVDSNCEYNGENVNIKVLTLMSRVMFLQVRKNSKFPNSVIARNVERGIANIYKLYEHDISKPVANQLKLEPIMKPKQK